MNTTIHPKKTILTETLGSLGNFNIKNIRTEIVNAVALIELEETISKMCYDD